MSEVKTILLCDDNRMNRRLVVVMLEGMPYRVVETTTGQECLEYARADYASIDLILLDISMSGMSGMEVCRSIRESEPAKTRTIPIIAYTAHAMADEQQQFIDAGFDGVLTKPITPADLGEMLDKFIDSQNSC